MEKVFEKFEDYFELLFVTHFILGIIKWYKKSSGHWEEASLWFLSWWFCGIGGKCPLHLLFCHVLPIVSVFYHIQGVPFAEPPTRFSPPIPKTPWQGVLDTKVFKPACMQPIYNNFPIVDEDCLYLNVYAPHPRVNVYSVSFKGRCDSNLLL